MKRLLVLEDGSVYQGYAFGSNEYKVGELVFNTAMTGYQEILTDHASAGQIVMFTYPLIGNCGINRDDYESVEPSVFGVVVKDYCDFPSNWRSQETMEDFLKRENIPGIYGVDTRAITRKLRDKGTMRAVMCDGDANVEEIVKMLKATEIENQVAKVATSKLFSIPNNGKRIVLIDFGVKLNIVRELSKLGLDIIVLPYDVDARTVMSFHPDGVFLSNGPSDPRELKTSIETIKELLGEVTIFGVGLGHELIALACGAEVIKLPFGHRGGNHPVIDLKSGKVTITSQNHGFAVDVDSLKGTELEMTHKALNDGSCEGVSHTKYPCFGLQFYPELGDEKNFYHVFKEMIDKGE